MAKRKVKKANNKTGNNLLIFGFIILSFLGIFIYKQLPELQKVLEKDPIIPISTLWNMDKIEFSDSTLDLAFEYPTTLEVTIKNTEEENAKLATDYPESDYKYGIFYATLETPEIPSEQWSNEKFDYSRYIDNTAQITIHVYENSQEYPFEEFIRNEFKRTGVDGKTPIYESIEENLTPIKIKGEEAYSYEGNGGGEKPRKTVYFPYKRKIYTFTLMSKGETGSEYSNDAEAFFDRLIDSVELK